MAAGDIIRAGSIPGQRIATSITTTDSGTFTSETLVASVTAAVVAGRTYGVTIHTNIISTVANDNVTIRIREDNATGTPLLLGREILPNAVNTGIRVVYYVEFTATVTTNKTFVSTFFRSSGTGNISRRAAGDRPTYFLVDYLSG